MRLLAQGQSRQRVSSTRSAGCFHDLCSGRSRMIVVVRRPERSGISRFAFAAFAIPPPHLGRAQVQASTEKPSSAARKILLYLETALR
jgi:hypothetical protein